MSGLFKRWMIARSADNRPLAGDARGWRAAHSGGAYGRELRDLTRRLRREAPGDLEWPSTALRRRTLEAVRDLYIHQRRRRPSWWARNLTLSPGLMGPLAACVIVAAGISLAIHQGGPELFDSIRSSFTQPVHTARVEERSTLPPSDALGLPVDDERPALAHERGNGADGPHLRPHNEPNRADVHDTHPRRPRDDRP